MYGLRDGRKEEGVIPTTLEKTFGNIMIPIKSKLVS